MDKSLYEQKADLLDTIANVLCEADYDGLGDVAIVGSVEEIDGVRLIIQIGDHTEAIIHASEIEFRKTGTLICNPNK